MNIRAANSRVARAVRVAAGLAILAVHAACLPEPTAPTQIADLEAMDLVTGTGTLALTGATLTVHYAGWLYDELEADRRGPPFDASSEDDPFVFTLGAGQVIPGWDQGLVGMRVGGTRRLVIPPSLGYGPTRRGNIPPNATLLFEVELLDVQ